uniref:F-box domain-containing protein n=1 Tax=Xiphophorus couchianus TaxID=32473 RepID=A0A3B5MYH8_9TELE
MERNREIQTLSNTLLDSAEPLKGHGERKKKRNPDLLSRDPKAVKEEEDNRFPEEDRWGQLLPEEVLVNIFQMLVVQDGAVPFLCRVSRVCRLWNAAAATLTLKPPDALKYESLFFFRFSQLRDFTLCHWATSVDFALETVSEFCPHLRSVHLSYCRGVTGSGLRSLGLHSRTLVFPLLQFQVEGLVDFLEEHGKFMFLCLPTALNSSYRSMRLSLQKGFCPDLELLEVNKKLDSKDTELSVCFQSLQKACPKLKAMRKRDESEAGFPLLDEFCIANTEYSYITDQVLRDVLFGSTRLRVLDLRGSTRITTFGLAQLPCSKLECLFWGQYFTKNIGFTSVKKNLQLLMEKWGPTLQQLDITNQPFTEADLEVALTFLTQVAEADTLLSLNLSGTKITAPVIEQMTALGYLNLSSCRNLPRGVKKIYRSQEEIRELLANLH